jgi:hypothetical protein
MGGNVSQHRRHVHSLREVSRPDHQLIRGASPLGLPYTRSRSPLRRLASAYAKAPARPRLSTYGAKAGRSRGSLAAARSLTSVRRRVRASCKASTAVRDQLVGVPVKLGARGVEQITQIELTSDKDAALKKSAAAVKELTDVIGV